MNYDILKRVLGVTSLQGANLRCANLRNAYLPSANLRSTDLRCANLHSADLRGADLYDAYLDGSNLGKAQLDGIRVNWQSNELLSVLLIREAETTEQCLVAAKINVNPKWDWNDIESHISAENFRWIIDTLKPWIQDGDDLPIQMQAREARS